MSKIYKTTVQLERVSDELWEKDDREDFEHWLEQCPEIMKVTYSETESTDDSQSLNETT